MVPYDLLMFKFQKLNIFLLDKWWFEFSQTVRGNQWNPGYRSTTLGEEERREKRRRRRGCSVKVVEKPLKFVKKKNKEDKRGNATRLVFPAVHIGPISQVFKSVLHSQVRKQHAPHTTCHMHRNHKYRLGDARTEPELRPCWLLHGLVCSAVETNSFACNQR